MNITEVRITIRNEEKLKAFASITFDDCFVVRGLKVINGSQGYFVSMPSRKRKDGSYQDIAHPINNEMRKEIEDKVLDAFEKELNNPEATPDSHDGNPEATPDSHDDNPEATPDSHDDNPGATPDSHDDNPEATPDSHDDNPGATPDSHDDNPGATSDSHDDNPGATSDSHDDVSSTDGASEEASSSFEPEPSNEEE